MIKIKHYGTDYRMMFRYYTEDFGKKRDATIVELIGPNNELVAVGFSYRNPLDQYSKERGRKAAITNMFDNYIFSKEYRKALWQGYFNRKVI
ncbi:MAG TPA: hypothetical protein VKR58_15395 [Aquella sp.]|nr:hypothetical protein [Aquella sp.]